MSPSVEKKSHLIDAGIPPWSYNLFQEKIPATRNCKEAKIPIQFCPCIDERKDMSPGFYVGYSTETIKSRLPMPALNYDWRIRKFSGLKLPGYHVSKFNTPKNQVSMNTNVLPPSCNSTLASYIDEKALQDSWQLIQNITSMYPGSDVSGGIFLYRRQTILLSYLLQSEIASRAAKKDSNGKLEPFRVCETGFGAGHSTSLFLSAAPNVEVVSFDKFDRPYQLASFYALRSYFGKRLTRSIGDSCKTVKSYGKQCDFLHGSSLCKTDNIDLIQKAKPGVILTSTAMNSLEDGSVYFGGENAQWKSLLEKDCIENVVCFEEEETIINSKLYLARGKEQKIKHEFCFATNTGQCSSKDDNDKHDSTTNWSKDSFCQDWILGRPET